MDPDLADVRVELLTTAPLHVGLGALVEGGPRLRAATSIGVLPGPYVRGIDGAIGWFVDDWGADEQQLVQDTLQRSLVWQLQGGWRPVAGLYLHGGYTLVALGGSSTTADLVHVLTGAELPAGAEGAGLDATATLHLLGPEVGWEARPWRGLALRAGLGWSFTVASETRITPGDDARPVQRVALEALSRAGERWLDQTFTGYAHPPTVTVAAGWSL